MFVDSHLCMISNINLVQSAIDLPCRNPFCSRLIILFKIGQSLFVIQSEIILYVVFSREIGLQFFNRLRAFPVLGRQVIRPLLCDCVRAPLEKHSFTQSMKKYPNSGQISIHAWGFIVLLLR